MCLWCVHNESVGAYLLARWITRIGPSGCSVTIRRWRVSVTVTLRRLRITVGRHLGLNRSRLRLLYRGHFYCSCFGFRSELRPLLLKLLALGLHLLTALFAFRSHLFHPFFTFSFLLFPALGLFGLLLFPCLVLFSLALFPLLLPFFPARHLLLPRMARHCSLLLLELRFGLGLLLIHSFLHIGGLLFHFCLVLLEGLFHFLAARFLLVHKLVTSQSTLLPVRKILRHTLGISTGCTTKFRVGTKLRWRSHAR